MYWIYWTYSAFITIFVDGLLVALYVFLREKICYPYFYPLTHLNSLLLKRFHHMKIVLIANDRLPCQLVVGVIFLIFSLKILLHSAFEEDLFPLFKQANPCYIYFTSLSLCLSPISLLFIKFKKLSEKPCTLFDIGSSRVFFPLLRRIFHVKI